MLQGKNAFVEKWGKWLMFAGCFLFFAYVGWCTPLTGDDVEFSSLGYESLEEYWTYISQYGNGRFLGNILAVTMANVSWLRILGKAFVLASCVMLLPQVLGMHSLLACCGSFLLMVGMDSALFGEVCSWASGFSNYITPVWLLLIILKVLLSHTDAGKGGMKSLLIFPLAVCAQLFIEHSSGINLLLALYVVVRQARKKDIARSPAWAWLVGSCVGLAIMLFAPSLFYITDNHTASYRTLYLGSIQECVTACIRNALRLSTYYLNVNGLPLSLGCAVTLWLTRSRRGNRANKVLALLWALCTGYLAFCMCHDLDTYLGKTGAVYHVLGLAALLALIGIWALAAWQLDKDILRERVLLCTVFGLVALAPILIVHPVPIRVVFQSYYFFAAGALASVGELAKTLDSRFLSWGRSAALVMTAVSILNLFCVYTFIGHVTRLREAYILDQIACGAETIQVFTVSYDYCFDDCIDELTIEYYQKLAGYPVAFDRIHESDWLWRYG